MDFLVIIFLIIAAINWINKSNKKAKAEAERRRRAAMAAQEPARPGGYAPPVTRAADPRFPDYTPEAPAPRKTPALVSELFERAERAVSVLIEDEAPAHRQAAGTEDARFPAYTPIAPALEKGGAGHAADRAPVTRPSMGGPVGGTVTGRPISGTVTASSLSSTVSPTARERARHDLAPSFVSGHAHVENSMGSMRETHCPPSAAAPSRPAKKAAPVRRDALAAITSGDPLVTGIILGEILGKPKALQARR